jgi:hypothetical protein
MLFYRLGNNNQTDPGDEIEGLKRKGLKAVPPAVAFLSYMTPRQLNHTFADFFSPNWDFFTGFSLYL